MYKFRLFFVGMFMGIADLIPGVSGGTVAFICGIYQNLLEAIKSLQLHSLKKIAWPFILPLGSGIALSFIFFSRPLYYVLSHYPLLVNAFFFGLIGGSSYFCFRKAALKRPLHYAVLVKSFLTAFVFSAIQSNLSLHPSFLTLFFCGALASFAMLLPGISGSYLLHVLGLYSYILFALGHPLNNGSLTILASLATGVTLGLILFSRIISWLLIHFYQMTLSILIGLMVGSMRCLWPFESGNYLFPILFISAGLAVTFLLEILITKTAIQGVSKPNS